MLTRKDKRLLIQNAFNGSTLKDSEVARKVFFVYSESLLKLNETQAKEAFREILEDEKIWKGYQEFNRIMRETNSDNYNYSSKEVTERREQLTAFYNSIV
jgi:hypothetical protein